MNVEAVGAQLGKQRFDLLQKFRVVGAIPVEPEHRGRPRGFGAAEGQLHPVANRCVFGLAHPPDVAFAHRMLHQHGAVGRRHSHRARARHFKGLVVRSVLFGLLGHQAHVGHAAHGGGVVRAIGFAVFDHRRVHAGVGAVGNDGLRGLTLALGVPHASGVTQHGGHRSVDDDIAGDVQVGDPAVGVDHGDAAEVLGHIGGEGRLVGVALHLADGVAKAVVGVHAQGGKRLAVLLKKRSKPRTNAMPKDDRVRDLHHGRFHVQREQYAVVFGTGDLLLKEGSQRSLAHKGGIHHFAGFDRNRRTQLGGVSRFVGERDVHLACFGDRDRLLVAEEVAIGHAGHVAVGVGRPFPHAVGVGAGVGLHAAGGSTVGVAFPQHRVHGTAFHRVVTRLEVTLFIGGGVVGIVGQVEALALQLGDRGFHLRHRSADVGQLDDVGFGGQAHGPKFGEVVGHALVVAHAFGELAQDAGGQRNVSGFHIHTCRGGKAAEDGQEGDGGERGGFVGDGVNDSGGVGHRPGIVKNPRSVGEIHQSRGHRSGIKPLRKRLADGRFRPVHLALQEGGAIDHDLDGLVEVHQGIRKPQRVRDQGVFGDANRLAIHLGGDGFALAGLRRFGRQPREAAVGSAGLVPDHFGGPRVAGVLRHPRQTFGVAAIHPVPESFIDGAAVGVALGVGRLQLLQPIAPVSGHGVAVVRAVFAAHEDGKRQVAQ